jgi:hypothetical protein
MQVDGLKKFSALHFVVYSALGKSPAGTPAEINRFESAKAEAAAQLAELYIQTQKILGEEKKASF